LRVVDAREAARTEQANDAVLPELLALRVLIRAASAPRHRGPTLPAADRKNHRGARRKPRSVTVGFRAGANGTCPSRPSPHEHMGSADPSAFAHGKRPPWAGGRQLTRWRRRDVWVWAGMLPTHVLPVLRRLELRRREVLQSMRRSHRASGRCGGTRARQRT